VTGLIFCLLLKQELKLTVAQAACRPTSKETLEHSFIELFQFPLEDVRLCWNRQFRDFIPAGRCVHAAICGLLLRKDVASKGLT
jgi:hypothetical protein